MSSGMTKPIIFISYSHKDEPEKPGPDDVAWLTFVQSFLAPVVKVGIFDIWVDQHLHGSDSLDPEIKSKLAECDIFVLLASRHSLASSYIVETEIATMRKRQSDGEDVRIFPIILSPIPNMALGQLKDLVLRPKDGKPLSLLPKNDREVAMAQIADDIAAVAAKIGEKKRASTPEPTTLLRSRLVTTLSTSSDAKSELHYSAMRRDYVDVTHLPETAYERLVGRDDELKRLDEAWADSKVNVLSLVAEGGAGKSALINEWLKRLQIDNYRGAEIVLGWSFYSQGTKERATSTDEFLNWALQQLEIDPATTSATAKGEAIAQKIIERGVLLVLDGIEPLQHGPDAQLGELKDQGLRALLRRVVSAPPTDVQGLIVLTSRLAVKNIARWRDGTAPVIDVERLSDSAGASLLRDNSVWGTDKELKAAARDFGGHALALGLLASFLKETQNGDARRRDHIRAFFADSENPRHDHAKRVMESYEKEWLAGRPELLEIMHIVGLFDRPASSDCLKALRAAPAINGLTDHIIQLSDDDWNRHIARLREASLLAPKDPTAPDSLDAHPLIREWFGERLKQINEIACRAAHNRLYEHLRDTAHEGGRPTLQDLAPLYQAVGHGCKAERHSDALDEIYIKRICRRLPSGMLDFYSKQTLGAFGTDLATISSFFDGLYDKPISDLPAALQSWVASEAAVCLQAQGRFAEALVALRSSLDLTEPDKIGNRLSVLSEIELVVGRIGDAAQTAEQSIALLDGQGNERGGVDARSQLAETLLAQGNFERAQQLFSESEEGQNKLQPTRPQLYSIRGYWYCDLILARGEWAAARDRAKAILKGITPNFPILDRAAVRITLGNALLALAIESTARRWPAAAQRNTREAEFCVNEAVNYARAAGQSNFVAIALVCRAAFCRSIGDWDGCRRDLDEVEEIADPGPMPIHLCNLALERARLAFAKIEAHAPLNGMLEKSKRSKPVVPSAEQIIVLKGQAEKQLNLVADYVETTGYHRRDAELAELQAVLRSERKFVDLPPRV